MGISMSSASLPVFRQTLRKLRHIVAKAGLEAAARSVAPATVLQYRLAPDMLPFSRQVTVACDVVKLWTHRMLDLPVPQFANDETSFEQLQARIDLTLSWLDSLPSAALDGLEEKTVTLAPETPHEVTMRGEDYLTLWALPNLFFHVTTAYAILRHNGFPLGKRDYLYGR